MTFAYGFKQIPIDNLHNISPTNDNFYNYKGLNFLTKLNLSNDVLIVNFHGAVDGYGTDRIIFRGWNYKIPNADIICISDYLMGIYPEYQVNWCLSSAKYDSNSICIELFEHLTNAKKYSHVIFTGSSAGCYPSMFYACYFNQIALVSNPQIYLEEYGFKYRYNKNPWGFYHLAKMLASNNDSIIYEPKSMEKHILNHKPKKIIIYNNVRDNMTLTEHSIPFVRFIQDNNLTDLVELIQFDGINPPDGKTHHHIGFPEKLSHAQILTELVCKLLE